MAVDDVLVERVKRLYGGYLFRARDGAEPSRQQPAARSRRYVMIADDHIVIESVHEIVMVMDIENVQVIPKDEADPAPVAAWEEEAKFYLAARDDVREDATGLCYVDLTTSDREMADNLVQLVGGGQPRTRREMEEHPELAPALVAWENGDDWVRARQEDAG